MRHVLCTILVGLLAGCASPSETGDDGSTGAPSGPGRFPGCTGEGKVTFANPPMRASDYVQIQPYGLVVGAHVTPIDHMYFGPPFGSARDAYEVRAIADGVIYEMGPRDINVDSGQAKQREWRMDIAHTCDFVSYFDLLTSLDPAIEAEYERLRVRNEAPWQGIPVKAGQLVGRIGGQTLDFGVYDFSVTLPGFVVPAHYDREPLKVHTVDPYPHFPEAIRSEMLAKNIRQVEPRAGKIDYDVDGKMVGNWFVQGTNGYAGVDPAQYWRGHLALCYDFIDPAQLRLSIGDWAGDERAFGVHGNGPDWSNLSVASGLVEVELQQYGHWDPASGRTGFGPGGVQPGDDVKARNLGPVQGVALLQQVEDRVLKVEVFPGKSASEVSGFTSAAKLYER